MAPSAALSDRDTPPFSRGVFGPCGIDTPVVASPSTCTRGSPAPTARPLASAVVHPVRALPLAPLHEITEAEGEVAFRSSNWPAPPCSAPAAEAVGDV